MVAMNDEQKQAVYKAFYDRVNMAPKELERWLETEPSQRVGRKTDDGESVGHKSGRRIVEIKHKKKAELTDDDYRHMRKVVNYVKRHAKQPPHKTSVEDSRWRYSLMNWGHDPMKD